MIRMAAARTSHWGNEQLGHSWKILKIIGKQVSTILEGRTKQRKIHSRIDFVIVIRYITLYKSKGESPQVSWDPWVRYPAIFRRHYASVNSSSAHPPRANPRALAFLKKIGRIPRGGDEKRGQMSRPRDRRLPTFLQFFLLTSQLFSILMQWY